MKQKKIIRKTPSTNNTSNSDTIKTILKAAPIGIGIIKNREFVEVNDRFAKMVGYTKKELIGKNSRMIYPSDEEYEYVGKEKYRQIDKKGIGSVITKFKTKGDKHLDILLTSAPIDKNDYSKGVVFTAENISEKIENENKLKSSEEKFRKAFETNPDAINLNRLEDGMYISVNDGFLELTGYTRKEVIGKSSKEIDIWYDLSEREELVKRLQKTGSVKNYEAQFKLRNGDIRIGLMSASIIKLDQTDCILSITRDITERKVMERKLRESQQNYSQMFENMKDMAFIIDMKGRIVNVNNAALETLNYTKKELCTLSPIDLDDKLTVEEIYNLIQKMPKDGFQQFETVHIKKNRERIPVEIKSTMINYFGEKAILSVARDISARKKAEIELKQREENLRTLFDNIDELIFVVNEDGIIIEINNKVLKNLGYERNELIGKHVTKVHPPDKEVEAREIMSGLKNGKMESYSLPPLFTKNRKEIFVESYVKSSNWNGETAFFGICKDKTKLTLSEEKFSKAFHHNLAISALVSFKELQILEVNKEFYNVFGYIKGEVIGRNLAEVVGVSEEYAREVINQLEKDGFARNLQTIVYSKSKKEIKLLYNAVVIEIGSEKYSYMTAMDITDRNKREKKAKNTIS